ncbi:hypothetical protein F1652_19320 [Pluralibacter gergoviae]|nr:hypothetical protein [Pluralibacter gergoviae]
MNISKTGNYTILITVSLFTQNGVQPIRTRPSFLKISRPFFCPDRCLKHLHNIVHFLPKCLKEPPPSRHGVVAAMSPFPAYEIEQMI